MADAYCVWLYWGVAFFFFKGDGPAKPFGENGSRGQFWWKESDLQHLEEKKPNSASSWVNIQVGKETYLNFHSSSLLQKNKSPPEPLDLIGPERESPAPEHLGWAPSQTVTDQTAPRLRRDLATTTKQISVSSTARDFLLDSHVTFCWLGGQN